MIPMVSVVVATYRQEQSLDAALESLMNQTYPNYEIVLVDDNAKPEWNKKVHAIVEKFQTEYPDTEITYIENQQNQGSARTRNIGIKKAKGDYITFLDDDDVYLTEKIEHQVTNMIQEEADYSITDLYLYSEKGKLIDRRIHSYVKETDVRSLTEYHLMHHMTGTDSMMFRKDYIMRIGCFDEIDLGDEFYLMQKAISGDGKFCYIPGCYIKAVVHTGEAGLSSGQNKIDCEMRLYEFKKGYFDRIDRKSRRYIRMRHYAVLAFAELRRRSYLAFFKNAICAALSSPVGCVKLLAARRG